MSSGEFVWSERPRHSDAVCALLLDGLLLEPGQLLEVLAPEGWVHSPLSRLIHRTTPDVIDAQREIVEVLGYALWDVFSDNHSVIDADGTEYDLGSFRGTADFIAASINRRYPRLGRSYDYMDFYMGSGWHSDRADLRPVYRWIFDRLNEVGCQWIYSFPRLSIVDFGSEATEDDLHRHDPSDAVREELERAERAAQVRDLSEQFDRAFEDNVRKARNAPLPTIVAAFRDVFGSLPHGWPHPDM